MDGNQLIIKNNQKLFTMLLHEMALQGKHNVYNSMAAGIAAKILGVSDDVLRKSLTNFRGVVTISLPGWTSNEAPGCWLFVGADGSWYSFDAASVEGNNLGVAAGPISGWAWKWAGADPTTSCWAWTGNGSVGGAWWTWIVAIGAAVCWWT